MLTGPPFKFTGPISTLPPPKIKNYFKISVRTILTYFTTFIFSMKMKIIYLRGKMLLDPAVL